ncbi:hypothetical protein BXT89_14355 [Halopseudomonas pachastrellae]|uniref:Uncharacterized protein n=1 Tax=Halopseudomonas pachastrellae TaxID=254161 RepID=A0A1S8DES3_9GAMM|nr:hypothetical protein [Halopseudomonas pachastrellae]ONM43132.1 hypothetical protein BXT89_14355 [Halopseudomonas pachastrellae]
MVKPDFPMLLQPGVQKLSMADLHALAVAPFTSQRRQDLFQLFTNWQNAIRQAGVSGALWVDGSYLTEKPDPGDIDCVLWQPQWTRNTPMTPADQQQIASLMDHNGVKAVYHLDLYVERVVDFHRQAYWSGVLGFSHDRTTAKGFAEITL